MTRPRAAAVLLSTFLAAGAQVATAPSADASTALLTQQRTLVGLGYLRAAQATGATSSASTAAIKFFQWDRCLDRTGTVVTATNAQLVAVAKLVQTKLGRTPDGTLDGTDRAAMRTWQQGHSLAATGQADAATMKALGITRARACGNAVRGDITKPSTTFGCAKGTRNLGVHEGYLRGRATKIRLCAVTGLTSGSAESQPWSSYYVTGAKGDAIVIAQASGAYAGLVQLAKNSGHPLVANSSYRTMAHQSRLCRANARCARGDYLYVMRPGWSNHQLGAAIDFAGSKVSGTCARPASAATVASWTMINRNAARFGIHQYEPESWHWEAAPSPCA